MKNQSTQMQNAELQSLHNFDFMHCQDCRACLVRFATTPSRTLLAESLRDGACLLECSKGHKTVICLQDAPFEIHFYLGMDALLDGYYAESVFNITKAAERFHEWCIKLFLADVAPDELDKTWKLVDNASERQFGAFLFLHLNHFQKMPPVLHDQKTLGNLKWIELRNNTIHKGYLPTRDEARAYTKTTFEYIQKIITQLRKNDLDKIQKMTFGHLRNLGQKDKTATPSTLGGIASRFLARDDIDKTSFETELTSLRARKESERNRRPLSSEEINAAFSSLTRG